MTSSSRDLCNELRHRGVVDVDDSLLQRAAYSSDASLYRVIPQAVVRPRDAGEVEAVLAVCSQYAVPVTCRGAGTSIAGNAIGEGVVLDFSKYMTSISMLDVEARTATVDPGVLHVQLQRLAVAHGLRFGPDPSTHTRCTIGGMIGNNACGTRALGYGRTVDNVESLDIVTASGRHLHLDAPRRRSLETSDPDPHDALMELQAIAAEGSGVIGAEFARFSRQVSGYSLEHLVHPDGPDIRRLVVGSEGTLAVVTGATVRLVDVPSHTVMLALGYPDMASAADAMGPVLEHAPTACEGFDSRLVDAVRKRRGADALPALPRGAGWLFVELTGASASEAVGRAEHVARLADALEHRVIDDAAEANVLWRIREDGAALAGRNARGEPAYPGWEDSAVPPKVLGDYLRALDLLLVQHGLTGMPYGHFGSGCLHLRLDFPLTKSNGRGVLQAFMNDAAQLVASFGGSLSGEHGDGRTRSELLAAMYSPQAIALFGRVKRAFDPTNLLNPGIIVDPVPLVDDVRMLALPPSHHHAAETGTADTGGAGTDGSGTGGAGTGGRQQGLRLRHDHGDLSAAVHRCTGVGSCRADSTATGGVMCPSYLATRDEKDSTRGRARVLQEMMNGSLVTGGFRAPEVHDALDLCLSCKACSTECPAGVDMASYKSEVLYQSYRHRVRPRSHYALGQLPRWVRLASALPSVLVRSIGVRPISAIAKMLAGVDQRRSLPVPATETFREWFRATATDRRTGGRRVVLLPDTFTNAFSPEVGAAAVRVLEDAGYHVELPRRPICCALTWITTGQLDAARRIVGRTIDELAPFVRDGIPIVGLEPSCIAALRADAPDLVESAAAAAVAGAVRTLAELLADTPGWSPPSLDGVEVVAQPHCHQRAVMGWTADEALLRSAGASVTAVGGCCGLAGNFGVERGHYEVSVAIAERTLLPRVREGTAKGAVVLADGFSCRIQIEDLEHIRSEHLAELLDRFR